MEKTKNQFTLLFTERFLPLFLTQFCGAFNDNLFKNALVILITFHLAVVYDLNAQVLITVVAGLFVLPFFLFSATAGQLADKYEKSFLIRIIKFVEIVLMVLTAFSFLTKSLWLLIILLFFMGAQSAFFGPLKYSILPQHLAESELVAGNGLVSAATYVAILGGTMCGGLLILHERGRFYVSAGIVGVAVLGYIASRFIPKAPAPSPDIAINWNIFSSTREIVRFALPNKTVFQAMLGKSWFWMLGSVFLSQFPTFAKDILGGNEEVSTLFLVLFSVGIGIGSIFCNRLLRGRVSGKLVPYGLVGMSAATALLYFFCLSAEQGPELRGALAFAAAPSSWGVIVSLVALAACGGIFSVPLYAIMQTYSPRDHRARTIACSNILDSFAMVLGAVFTALLLLMHFSVVNIFLVMGVLNLAMTPFLSKLARVD